MYRIYSLIKLCFALQTRVLHKNSVHPIEQWLSMTNLCNEVQNHILLCGMKEKHPGKTQHLSLHPKVNQLCLGKKLTSI